MTAVLSSARNRARFAAFVEVVATVVADYGGDSGNIVRELAPVLADLVRSDDWLDDAFAAPSPDHYRQYLLFCDARRRFSVVSFVWGPGQFTPIHDHGTWGLVGVLRGSEVSQEFRLGSDGLTAGAETVLAPGDVAGFTVESGDLHRVRNFHEDRASISIHVYGDDIGAVERRVFAEDGTSKPFVSRYSNDVLPNCWGAP